MRIAVNGVFTYFALESFGGLETEQAYLKGLDYNRTLEAAAAQRERGWQVELEQEPGSAGAGQDRLGDLALLDRRQDLQHRPPAHRRELLGVGG